MYTLRQWFHIKAKQPIQILVGVAMLIQLTVGGVITSFYFAWILSQAPPVSWIGENHLEYAHGISSSVAVSTLYLLSTVFTCFLSSDRWIKNFGKAVLVALMLTRLFYQEALVSVWCFFAAILSMILYFHFSSKEQVLLHQRQVA